MDWSVERIKWSIDFGLQILSEHPWLWQIGVTGFGLVLLTAFIALVKAGRSRPIKDSKKEKKSK